MQCVVKGPSGQHWTSFPPEHEAPVGPLPQYTLHSCTCTATRVRTSQFELGYMHVIWSPITLTLACGLLWEIPVQGEAG